MLHLKSSALFAAVLLLFASWANPARADSDSDFAALSQQAAAAREANNVAQAVALYKQATALNPQWEEGWWWLGSLQYDANYYPEAIEALRSLTKLNPQNAPGLGLLGLSEYEAGAHAESLRDIQHSLQLGLGGTEHSDQEHPDQEQMTGVLRFHEGLLLTEFGRFDDAMRAYTWFVQRNVHHDVFLTALGTAALHRNGTPEAALAAGKASFLSMSGSTGEAVEAFRELASRFSTTPFTHFLYASVLVPTDLDGAVAELQREVQIAPSNGPAYALLSYLLMQDGDMADAIPAAQKAQEHDPDAPLTQYVQGRALVETGHLPQGIGYLENAVKASPGNLINHIALAAAYAKAGLPTPARQQREAAEKLAKAPGEIASR